MDAALIKIVAEIAAGAKTIEYLSVGLFAAMAFVVWYVRSRVGGYATKLGEIQAETAKIEDIKTKVEATTRVTAEIQSEFFQRDWRERERMTLTRIKLEEALATAYNVRESIGRQMLQCTSAKTMENEEAAHNKLSSIVALYLPSLVGAAAAIGVAALQVKKHAIPIHTAAQLAAIPQAPAAMQAQFTALKDATAAHMPPMQAAYVDLTTSLANFERLAAGEMNKHLP